MLPLKWVNEIFRRLYGRFGNPFLAKFETGKVENGEDVGLQAAKLVWAEELSDYTPDEIKRGLSAKYDYPPSLDEFAKACRPQVDPETAFYEAVEQMRKRHQDGSDKWSNKATYWAAESFGTYDLRNSSWQVAKTRWSRVYGEMLSEASLPDIPGYILAPKLPAPKIDKEEAKQKMAGIKYVFGSKPNRKNVIARWIVVIKEKHSSCGVRMAYEALKELRPIMEELLNAGMEEDAANELFNQSSTMY